MLCENCNANPATTHVKRTVNGVTKEYYLCQDCVNTLGFNSIDFFDSNGFFNALLGNKVVHLKQQKVCNKCNSSYKEIVKSGRMGCPDCYKTFKDEIMPSLLKMQNGSKHIGKKPNLTSELNIDEKEISMLEKELKNAILNEEYEKAATLRDEIREKRGELNG